MLFLKRDVVLSGLIIKEILLIIHLTMSFYHTIQIKLMFYERII